VTTVASHCSRARAWAGSLGRTLYDSFTDFAKHQHTEVDVPVADRLPKELKLAAIRDIGAANQFLREVIAAVLDGASPDDAAEMDRQTLRDWVTGQVGCEERVQLATTPARTRQADPPASRSPAH